MRLTSSLHHVPWRSPLRAAHDGADASGAPGSRPLILVRLDPGDGPAGVGEAAPLESYDGVSVAAAQTALSAYAPVLERLTPPAEAARRDASTGGVSALRRWIAATIAACAAADPLPQALAAVDLALWDLAGQWAGQPVWRLLGATTAPAVEINAVVGAVDPAAAADEAAVAVRAGYRCVKVKVGTADPVTDLARVRAVRAATGAGVAIRIDANGGWSDPDAALRALKDLAALGLELCEEPCHGAQAITAVTAASPVPIAADESAGDALHGTRVADAVCLKVGRGGISAVLSDARRARAPGSLVYLASTLDGPLGILGALHAAAAIGPDRACGLSTLDRFDRANPIPVRNGSLQPPAGPGLGADLTAWYTG